MTSSFVFWPVTCSFKSANIYARSFLQDALLFRSKSHVFFPVCFVVLNFAVVKRYICCALTLQNAAIVVCEGGHPRPRVVRVQARSGRRSKGTRGGETQPQCMLGRG